ncbi:ChaN family lipoprotein [Limnoraphis robusta Tam1]|uniref:ChaN family lipoprotein n=1 Tax=Limnoraphis robusta TaxID=1118279 RepID=UPI002B219679|nr:ChaN family lipoprotein [Limnoraphis robusta]MEA5539507.1 ChaN family lipoprotein [Limnoraphis robusta Tam1]
MNKVAVAKVFTWSLGFFLWCTPPTGAEYLNNLDRFFDSPALYAVTSSQQRILQNLKSADVVYLGETHDQLKDHLAQLNIIKALYHKNSQIVIGLEMFQRPYQEVLDQYIAGSISETELIEKSQYLQRWGFPWKNYAEILRFARQNNIPVLALNTPSEVTRKVAKEGLESLTDEDKRYIPPLSEIRTDNAEYRQMLQEIYQQHHHGQGNSAAFENFFLAQVLWDETMAETIAKYLQNHPKSQVIVLVGKGHIIYNYGIPSRVERRLSDRNLVQRSVIFSTTTEESVSNKTPIADYIWLVE